MKIKLILKNAVLISTLCTIFFATIALAENISNDFSNHDSLKEIKIDELMNRFNLKGEIVVLSPEGDKLINFANEERSWSFSGDMDKPLEANWRSEVKGLPVIALYQKWILQQDGRISVELKQYDDLKRDEKNKKIIYGKLLSEQKFILKDFSPIDLEIKGEKQKVVVRLTPELYKQEENIDVRDFPIAGKNIVIFNQKGIVWGMGINADGPAKFLGITTHLGTIYLSFTPFKGSQNLGDAKDGRIKLKTDNERITLQSELPFLPKGVRANVYAKIDYNNRSERLSSVRSFSSSSEVKFLSR
jgi:hypothetical protein